MSQTTYFRDGPGGSSFFRFLWTYLPRQEQDLGEKSGVYLFLKGPKVYLFLLWNYYGVFMENCLCSGGWVLMVHESGLGMPILAQTTPNVCRKVYQVRRINFLKQFLPLRAIRMWTTGSKNGKNDRFSAFSQFFCLIWHVWCLTTHFRGRWVEWWGFRIDRIEFWPSFGQKSRKSGFFRPNLEQFCRGGQIQVNRLQIHIRCMKKVLFPTKATRNKDQPTLNSALFFVNAAISCY